MKNALAAAFVFLSTVFSAEAGGGPAPAALAVDHLASPSDDGDIARLEDFSFSRLRISAADRDRHEHLFRGVSFDDVAVDAP